MQQVENELDQAQEQLSAANTKLDEKEKALQNVSSRAALAVAPPQPSTLIYIFLSSLCVLPRPAPPR